MRTATRTLTVISSAIVLASALAACGTAPNNTSVGQTYPSTYPNNAPVASTPAYVEYGRVTNVEVISTQEKGRGTGVGAILGAVAGGVVGNQIGSGGGRDAARVVGIVGGGVAGNAIEARSKTQTRESYRVSVQVDSGATRAYDIPTGTDLRAGDRVRIENNTLYRI